MKKIILLLSIIILAVSCQDYMPGAMAHIDENVEQTVIKVDVKNIDALIEDSNYEVNLNLDNTSYNIVAEGTLFAVVEPDGRLLALCPSFEKAREVIYEHNKLIK